MPRTNLKYVFFRFERAPEMFRTAITIALMVLVGMPHGLCFCHYVEAAPACQPATCCEAPQPADDHDDEDCPCQLRETLAPGATPVHVEPDDALALCCSRSDGFDSISPAVAGDSSCLFPPSHGPVPLIPCALRI